MNTLREMLGRQPTKQEIEIYLLGFNKGFEFAKATFTGEYNYENFE